MRSLSAAVHNNNVVSLRLRRSPFSRLLHPATLRHRATLRRVVRDYFSSPFTSVSVLPVTSPRTEKLYFTGSRVKTARFLLARNISNILWPDLNEENRSWCELSQCSSYKLKPMRYWKRWKCENSRCEHDFSWPRLIRSILKIDFPLLSTLFHSLLDKKYRAIVLENFSLPIQLSIYSREIIGIYFHSTANYQTDFLFSFFVPITTNQRSVSTVR